MLRFNPAKIMSPVPSEVSVELLVVDDDTVFREELAELLRRAGHHAEVSPSVPKAIEELEKKDFDMIFTDLKMPRHSGLELLETARTRWPRTLVVMITGFASVETAVQAMKAGAFDYISKPFRAQQVQRVMELAQEELRFRAGGDASTDITALARSWVKKQSLDVLVISPRSSRPIEGVTFFNSTRAEPAHIRDAVESFLGSRSNAGVIIEDAHLLLEGRKRQDILAFLGGIREKMEGRGPFVVTFDSERVSSSDLSDFRAAVVAPSTHSTLEVLGNPLRRSVLRRLAQGPCTFTQVMEAAGLDDSPKLAFHMRKLVDDGLLIHREEDYRITAKGQEAVRLLAEIDAMAPDAGRGNAVITTRPAG